MGSTLEWGKLFNMEYPVSHGTIRDGLCGIVNERKETPDAASDAEKYANYVTRRVRALATIALSVEPSLLYLHGNPQNQVEVWKNCRINSRRKHGQTS